MVLPTQPTSPCPLKPTISKEKDNPNFTTMAHHHRHLNNLLHFRGQNLHYQRHPPSSQTPPFEQDSTPTNTHTLRRVLARVDTLSILTTVTIPSSPTTTSHTTSFITDTTDHTSPTLLTAPPTPTTATTIPATPPKINAQTTSASRHEIILLALGIFILVGQLALIIWVGVRRRRFSLSHSSSTSTTCAYHHSRWHRENCPRELNRLQLDGRGGGRGCSCRLALGLGGGGVKGGTGHKHGKGGNCLWKEAFGDIATSPGGWRTANPELRAGEGVERVEREAEDVEGEGSGSGSGTGTGTETGSGTGSGFDEDEDVDEGIRSRGNSVVIAGAHELVERVKKRNDSLETFLMGVGAEVVPDINETVTRNRSHTFSAGLGRRRISSSAGEAGLRERRGSAAREGDVEMGVGRTSGLNTDFGGKFDGNEEHDSVCGSERRRGSWVQILRRYSGVANQYEFQDPEKGDCRYRGSE